jgi:hypothetical protein
MRPLCTDRDKAMVLAQAGRCEVPGLRMADMRVGDRRSSSLRARAVTSAVVPIIGRFPSALGDYLHDERPGTTPTPHEGLTAQPLLPRPGESVRFRRGEAA